MKFNKYCVLFNSIASPRSFISWEISLIRHFSSVNERLRTNVAGKCWGIRRCHSETNNMELYEKEIYLIAGLGNYDYPGTRHSVGMKLINRLGEFLGIKITKNKECLGYVGTKELRHIHIVLLQPKLAMNINGTSVQKTAKAFNVPTRNIYLVHDELGKAVGKTSLKESGSAGGHNGVKSVIQSFRTDNIKRIRIGIDRPASIDMVGHYVLEKFKSDEIDLINKAINEGILKLAQDIGSKKQLSPSEILSVNDTLECD